MRADSSTGYTSCPRGWNPSKREASGDTRFHLTGQPALVKAGSYSAYKYKSAPVLSV